MAKHNHDTDTIDAFGAPKRRGRRPTGNAKSAAQRQAEYRQRKAQAQKMADWRRPPSNEYLLKEKMLLEDERNAAFRANRALEERIAFLEVRCETLEKENALLLKRQALRR